MKDTLKVYESQRMRCVCVCVFFWAQGYNLEKIVDGKGDVHAG